MIAPEIGAALITGGSGLIGGIADFFSSKAANMANAAAIRGTNELNWRMFQRGQQFNREMYDRALQDSRQNWYMQNEYNDPKLQFARLQSAGINPLVSGDVNAQSTTSIASPSAPISPSGSASGGTPFVPVDIGSHLRQAAVDSINAYSQVSSSSADARLKHSEAALNEIDAKTRSIQNRVMIANLRKDGKISDAEYKRLMLENDFNERTLDKRIEGVGLENEQLKESAESLRQQAAYQKEQIATEQLRRSLMKEANQRDWKRLQQDIEESASRIALNGHLGEKAVAEAAESIERKNKLNWENRPYMRILLNRQLEATIERIKSETAVNEQKTSIYGAVGTAAGAIGTAAGMYYGGKHLLGRGLKLYQSWRQARFAASWRKTYGSYNHDW